MSVAKVRVAVGFSRRFPDQPPHAPQQEVSLGSIRQILDKSNDLRRVLLSFMVEEMVAQGIPVSVGDLCRDALARFYNLKDLILIASISAADSDGEIIYEDITEELVLRQQTTLLLHTFGGETVWGLFDPRNGSYPQLAEPDLTFETAPENSALDGVYWMIREDIYSDALKVLSASLARYDGRIVLDLGLLDKEIGDRATPGIAEDMARFLPRALKDAMTTEEVFSVSAAILKGAVRRVRNIHNGALWSRADQHDDEPWRPRDGGGTPNQIVVDQGAYPDEAVVRYDTVLQDIETADDDTEIDENTPFIMDPIAGEQ